MLSINLNTSFCFKFSHKRTSEKLSNVNSMDLPENNVKKKAQIKNLCVNKQIKHKYLPLYQNLVNNTI